MPKTTTTASFPPRRQLPWSLPGLIALFILMILGWYKLRYGFNYIDEGMYMTDGWRLAAGDRLFPDSSINALLLYSLFNDAIFRLNPDITLLGFRQLQLSLTFLALLAIGYAVWRRRGEYWFLPLILSVFAFTGLDTMGMSANLSYYTYPHLFITLYTACLLLGLEHRGRARAAWMAAAGLFLWAVGFSFLPLTATSVVPILLFAATRQGTDDRQRFTIRDLLAQLVPVAILWVLFLATTGGAFFAAVFQILQYIREGGRYSSPWNTLALQYMAAGAGFAVIFFAAIVMPGRWRALALVAAAAGLYTTIESNLFGHIPGYWMGWFTGQMWFCVLLAITLIIGLARALPRRSQTDRVLLLTLFVPAAVYATVFVTFSSLGILTLTFASIGIVIGLSLLIVDGVHSRNGGRGTSLLALLAITVPFYYQLAWADWRFTYFDLPPEGLTHIIDKGFGAGIRTNAAYKGLNDWLLGWSARYSNTDQFAISFDQAPMAYMITKRRPALNHSWTGWAKSNSLRHDAIALMRREGREPQIAFRFTQAMLFFPVSLRDGTFRLAGSRKFAPDDPINGYVTNHMKLVERFRVNGRTWAEFYVGESPAPTTDSNLEPLEK